MSKQIAKPSLSQGNHIYLYRLLRDALGCGKQTFITQVEEALAAGDMAAVDLGFESTRELLEELDDCIKLTVFKGGRIYATVIANERWDVALAKGDEPKQKDTGRKQKPWKKKKGDKALKAVRPKHVKCAEPEPEPVPEPEPKPEAKPCAEAQPVADVPAETADNTAPETELTEKVTIETVELINSEIFSAEDGSNEEPAADATEEVAEPEPSAAPEPSQPKISLTVVYDPEHANAGVTTIESTPVEKAKPEANAVQTLTDSTESEPVTAPAPTAEPSPKTSPALATVSKAEPKPHAKAAVITETQSPKPRKKQAVEPAREPEPMQEENASAEHEPKPVPTVPAAHSPEPEPAPKAEHAPDSKHAPKPKPSPEPAPAAAPKPELPKIPEDYPVDFALEVFCPGPLLHELSTYLPYGADVLGIVGEYYWIAREHGTIQASRNRATFPLRYTRDGERHEVMIRIRRSTGGPGAAWTIDKIEPQGK